MMTTRLRGEINEEAGVMQNSATTLEGEPLYLGVHPPHKMHWLTSVALPYTGAIHSLNTCTPCAHCEHWKVDNVRQCIAMCGKLQL